MEQKTLRALCWIVEILDRNNISYGIGGGFAAHVYGSGRPINDIDISLSGKYFPVIVSEVKVFIKAGPKHYTSPKWDCDTLSVDITDNKLI